MGGPANPPDRPYIVKTLSYDDDKATAELQAARDAGFEVLFAVMCGTSATRVILGNYKGK